MQVQLDLRRAFAQQGQRLGNVSGRVAGGLFEHRHVQVAAQALVDVVQAAAKAFGGGQQALGGLIELLAFGRERKTGAPAPAQHQAHAGFQVFDVAADGGHGDVELQLGRGHAAAVHHRLEHPQQADVHVAQLAENGPVFHFHVL